MDNTRQFLDEIYREWAEKGRKFCAYRERCTAELSQKFRQLGASEPIARSLIETLASEGFVDDNRFARVFARGKFNQNHWGRLRIRSELQARQVSPTDIQDGLSEIPQLAYEQTLHQLAAKKANELKNKGKDKIALRTASYLTQKGYESDLIWQAIKDLGSAGRCS